MHTYHFGNVSVMRVTEQRGPGFAPEALYPDWDPLALEQHHRLMVPDCFDPQLNRFIASIHTWVVKTPHHTILVDSCAGNHKERPGMPRFHQQQLPFLERLLEAGVTPESVDYVMCTHLHADHCGWNTRLIDGRWVPTFPNAKYVFSRAEHEYWLDQIGQDSFNANVFEDSVLPVIEQGQAQIVDNEGLIGDALLIHPTPGHSVGHLAIELVHRAQGAIFSGDIMHQPLQVFRPEWNSCFCSHPQQARASRHWLLEQAAGRGLTVFTSHFAKTSAGLVTEANGQFDWRFI
ncbi:MBL fold metallo-hydrolase [Pseudomonas sp. B22129]|uniref:MBL fold metallo-hydrolase n=1 Tax=Pseudomonas sp. B22129 TaxID=3235111 RepID=UPI0037840FF4